ncbi:MAG: GFA family protein [Alphaproteobacteria bacterium]|nr:GFA family protein [Alphaproteobacteria bacterium]
MSWKKGGCHCGGVVFEVETPDEIELVDCNCSICSMSGYLHLLVPGSRFRLLRGQDLLTTYTFATQTAKHLFCSRCGIKSFYVPRSHPDGFSVNYRCLNASDFTSVTTTPFDGRLWDDNAAKLKPLES